MNKNSSTFILDQKGQVPSRFLRQDEVICIDSRLAVCGEERIRHTIISMLVSAILGWLIGVAQLIYIGSWKLIYWEFMPLIPLCSALGWSLLGMIVGGSGVFSRATVSPTQRETDETYRADIAA